MKYDALITNALELIAAIAGFYHLSLNKNSILRPLVYFLVFTIFIEAIGSYASFVKTFDFLKPLRNTVFEKNLWLFNFYIILSLLFYLFFFKNLLSIKIHKKVLTVLFVMSIIIMPISTYSASLFSSYVEFNFLWTTLSVFICVALYYYEILISDKVLIFYKSSMFYISTGLLLWWLIFPPMIFYMPYYKKIYPEVVNFRAFILIGTNVILYGCYIIGFLWGKEQ